MKIKIIDKDVLVAVKFLDIFSYLHGKGWQESQKKPNHWVAFTKGADYEVIVPSSRDISDYPRRIYDILTTLEISENRSQQEILGDISAVMTDVIRIRIGNGELMDGHLPLEDGVRVVEKSRELLLAAACSTVQPKPLYQKRKPDEAMEYLKKVKLGQTERGSYTITLHSPVTPALGQPALFEIEEPFERRVTTNLITGLTSAKNAAENASISGIDAFKKCINEGVSANLCESLVGLMDFGEIRRDAHVAINWASARPKLNADAKDGLHFTPDFIPILSEVVRVFKENEPIEDFMAIGPVVKLERPEGAQTGTISVLCQVYERTKPVAIVLEADEYDVALRAHRDCLPISCSGVLKKEGRSLVLKNPTNFRITD